MAWEARSGLKPSMWKMIRAAIARLNGLGSPFGIETDSFIPTIRPKRKAKWPGKPVRD